ncbi:helix-turn-helix domain-containing protein [Actinomycetospora lemnae]|uniref:Helix-turn-helix domain-containing protein n=1 Tax=Actinomycetospora lemnae TaxID=3019891 RepID=A0ABT5STD8_9PSEU|nr:helix-turn-helix domain-containing protein [Actinomycetospora sp. DW7H6]MDD7965446.1 helix-turn-helix domain-containing protein [Actinomycetospora sp. DW7H6]
MTGLPALVEDVDDVLPDQREAAVEALMSRTHLDMAVRLAPDRPRSAFRARVRRHRLHDLTIVDTACDPCSGVRSRRRAARTSPALDEVGGASRLFRSAVLEPTASATQLLAGYLDLLARSGAQLDTAARGAARNAALELVAAALAGAGPSSGTHVPTPPRALVDAWIEGQLPSGDLRPERIAAAQGVSVRTLYRMFEESGETVAAYVRTRRLARARHDIVTTAGTITDIAIRWGFTDASHFSRAFRGAYGYSPSDYRERFSAVC